jgi:PAS domain S-box-containing protein
MDHRYQYAFDAIPLGVVLQDPDGTISAANPAAEKILGLSLDQLQGRTSFDPRWHSIHEDGSDFPGQDHPAMITLRTGQPVRDVVMGVFNPQTNKINWININAVVLSNQPNPPPYPVMTTFEDITERMQADQQVRQLTRLYATISQVNQAIVRVKTQQELFETVCQVAVTFGEFRLAWVGLYDSTNGVVMPVSVCVPSGPLPQPMGVINADQDPFKESMIGTALHTGEIACQADILNDPHMQFLHATARRFGYQSAASLPLRFNGQIVGLLNLAAAEPDFFNSEQEIKLLKEIELDISFALETIAAADRLDAAHRRTSEILESISDAFYSLDREERFTYVNRHTAQLWNKKPGELVGRRLTDIFPNADQVEAFHHIRQALAAQRVDHLETYSAFLDQWVETHIYPTENGVSVYFRDTSERKKAEILLQETKRTQTRLLERLNEAQHIANIGSWEWDMTTDTVWWSEETYRIFGVNPDEYIPSFKTNGKFIHPDDLEAYVQAFDRSLKYGDPLELDIRVLAGDGQLKYCYAKGSVARDDAGQPVRFIGTVMDITTRKQAQEQLQKMTNLLIEGQKIAHLGIFEYDAATRHTIWSEEEFRIYGYDPAQTSPDYDTMLANSIHPEDSVLLDQTFFTAMQHAAVYELEHRIMRPDGSVRWVFDRANPYFDQAGRLMRYVGVTLDITERKQADLELRTSQANFITIFENSPIALGISRLRDGKITQVNAAFASLYGSKPEEFIGRSTAELNIWAIPADRQRFIEQMRTENQVRNFESVARLKSGEERNVLVSGEVVNINGEPSLMAQIVDITERKRAEEALRKSEQKFNTLFNQSAVPLVLTRWSDHVYVNVNDAWVNMFGYTQEEIYGKTPTELAINRSEASRQRARSALGQDQPIKNMEGQVYTKSGEVRSILMNINPIEIEKERYLVTSVQDITDLKRAEQKVRQSEEKFFKAFQTGLAVMSIAITDTQQLIEVNDDFLSLFEYRREQVIGHTPQELDMYVDQNQMAVMIQETRKNGYLHNFEVSLKTRTGKIVELLTSTQNFQLDGISHTISTSIDITERKQMEEDLRRSNAELEQFAYVASHDLQEPLRTVAGMVELLQQRYQGQLDARADEYIHHAVDASNRMQKLINDLLDFSRVDRKGQPFEPTQVDMLLQTALTNLRAAITESQAHITYDPMPVVNADGRQLAQVFQNLVGNAIKFRSERPLEIHIGVEKIENGWKFAVQDNGIGIDPQYFERVFLLFQRLHTRRKYPGTGIGLALCKKIIERHGGKIWIESTLNQGATFFFTLPER